jgi:hypothetical protein
MIVATGAGSASPRILSYAPGEFVLAYGPMDGPQLLVLQPFFEELNRCRALLAGLCRALAARGIGCWLPDLPGTGESPRALADIGWAAWREAAAAAAALVERETGHRPRSLAVRGGALLDDLVGADGWRLSPVDGASLLTDLRRGALTGEGTGYDLPPALAEPLAVAEPADSALARTVRLAGDARPADIHLDGAALWRRSEPGTDPSLVTALADDIVDWSSR